MSFLGCFIWVMKVASIAEKKLANELSLSLTNHNNGVFKKTSFDQV